MASSSPKACVRVRSCRRYSCDGLELAREETLEFGKRLGLDSAVITRQVVIGQLAHRIDRLGLLAHPLRTPVAFEPIVLLAHRDVGTAPACVTGLLPSHKGGGWAHRGPMTEAKLTHATVDRTLVPHPRPRRTRGLEPQAGRGIEREMISRGQ